MLKVILMANWGLGLEILKTLINLADAQIHCVITRYDKETSDKWFNAVYDYAISRGINTFQEKLMTFRQLRQIIQENDVDLLIVHAFVNKLPKEVYSLPKYGSVNIHPSLLPKYRGPSPTHWIMKNKEKITGLTSHYVDDGFDTGDIICQAKVVVGPNDTINSIIEKQKLLVGRLLTETLSCLQDKGFKPIPQQEELASYFPRPNNEGMKN